MDTNDIKNLKAGQVVYLQNYPVTFKRRTMAGIVVNDDVAEDSDGNMCYFPAKYLELERFHLENGTKNTETPPKYDPCREFRKGDRVRLVQCNGRNPFDSFNGIEYPPDETIYTVEGDEYDNGKVELYATDSCDVFEIHHSNLELVTPIEEAEPYYVKNIIRGYAVYKRGAGDLAASCVFWSKYHPNAKEAAEAERDRLNAEYRKEMGK